MPSVKRKSTHSRTDVLESASSALRPSLQNKRPRLSSIENIDSVSRETSFFSEADFPSTHFEPSGNILQSYEDARDDISELSTDQEAERLDEATQTYVRKKTRHVENQAAECGILLSASCENFMCHRKLDIDFGPLINFIIGQNGSGKSAVLTAITLCLGGKATSTNRGQSLRSFVKEGAEKAVLTVKIKNQGAAAYKRDLYGDVIIVERQFNIHGGSSFKLKSKDGRIVSTKKSELDDITDFFALQLDNPVNVLTQDQARQFLNNSSHAEKYRFFMKGVQLEQLDQDYSILGESLDTTEAALDTVKEDCSILREKHDAAKKRRDMSQRQGTIRERMRKYQRQVAWVQVEEQERELEELEQTIEHRQARVNEVEEEFRNYESRYEHVNQASEEAQHEFSRIKEQKLPLEENYRQANDAFAKVRDDITACQTTHREIKQNLNSERKRILEAQRAIDEEYERLNGLSDGREADKRNEIREAEDALNDVRSRGQQHDSTYQQLEEAKSRAEDKSNSSGNQEVRKQGALKEAQRQLQELQKDNRDKFAPFDSSLRNVLKAIENERGFKSRPVGPLAWHVRNRKPQWQNIIERTFGGLLNNFIVTSRDDQTLLSNILRRCRCNYHILVADPNLQISRLQEPDERFNTILRTLEIDNEMVRNQLVITTAIEQTILVDSQAEAIRLMEGQMPENCKAIMCPHPRERGRGFRYMQGRGGSQKMEPVDPWRGLPRMKTDDQAAIRSQQETVQALSDELLEAEREKREYMHQVKQTLQALQSHKKRKRELQLEGQRAEDRIEELKAELEAMQPQDGKLDGLKQQLDEHQQQVQHLEQELEEAERERDNITLQNGEIKKSLDRFTTEMKIKDAEIKDAEKRALKYSERRAQALRQKNEADHTRDDAARELDHAGKERDRQVAHVADYNEKAQAISDRVPVDAGESYDSLSAKLDRMATELEHFQNQVGGDEARVLADYTAARTAWKSAERRFDITNSLLNHLKLMLKDRNDTWKHFRKYITLNARCIFSELMKDRGFQGHMLIDHKSKQLELQVNPDSKRSRGAQGRQTKTLSGGEKSFSTVCMLLALWEAMGSPIRCLDEFDVFMDSVNRDMSMKMMIECARQAVGRQFILITPQSMSGIRHAPDVKVVMMRDPERGQLTLNLPGA